MAAVDMSKYEHSPVHKAIIMKDYAGLSRIIAGLPQFCDPSEIQSESVALAEEAKADVIAAAIDRRDVPNRDTPLHLAVKFGDETAAKILMLAGVDWSLQNEQGWNALQDAICNREERIAKIILRHHEPLAWAKWRRRLPRLVGTMRRMRDFYMEITFHFESSVVPFISRIAPSDTYKIWKRGANLRADTTLAGFDGLKIQRSSQSFLLLGDGSEDGKVPPGSLCIVSHKDKEVTNALDGYSTPVTEADVQQQLKAISPTNMFRPSIDVTQAVLLPQTTWRGREKTEMVGPWKAKVYDMHNVVVSVKSRRVPGTMKNDEFSNSSSESGTESELDDILSEEEGKQLEVALKMDSPELIIENDDGIIAHHHSYYGERDIPIQDITDCKNKETKQEKEGWFSSWRRSGNEQGEEKIAPPRSSLCVEKKVGKDESHDSEYKKGLRPILWLSPDFPLQTEELLPLLDILANKVKAIRRLRELLTTKLPKGTFPVKVAIPVVPTVKVIVTFTKFEELQALHEFSTPPSSPPAAVTPQLSSSSWFDWIKSPNYQRPNSTNRNIENIIQDPFAIPSDYKWITEEAKKNKMQQKDNPVKAKGHK